jgi:NAD(P)-dependent dehydrogenase (short-subunit alcohol dehydrogenase family)
VLITGATSGIGRRTAEAFAAEGARVVFCGRREALGREVEAGIRRAGGEATYVRADVREPEQMRRLVDAAVTKYGRLDVAHNNAGIGNVPGGGALHEITLDHWRQLHATNLDGVFHALQAELPVMLRQGGGRIVNTVSTLGLVALPGNAAYVTSKHAAAGLVKAAALEYAARGIRVNGVAPGPIDTAFLDQYFSASQQAEKARLIAQLDDKVPLKRRGRPEEIARTVLFLASDDASFMNGAVVTVDGGMGAHEGSAQGEGRT